MTKRKEHAVPADELKHPSTKRAKSVDAHTPYDELTSLLESQKSRGDVQNVLHWFRSKDLRIHDNRALYAASEQAMESSAPLLSIYVHCPAELSWHGTSPARTDFILENLKLMQSELKELDIPLVILEAKERDDLLPTVLDFIKQHDVSHVFANHEYEVDELRRDVKVSKAAKDNGFHFHLEHDQTIMVPMTMLGSGGKPMQVFTPYHKAWCDEVSNKPELIDTVPKPAKNSKDAKNQFAKLFGTDVPSLPKDKEFASEKEKNQIRKLWPAGHAAGIDRMQKFMDKIGDYAATRSNPAHDSTSRMSAYFSAGVVSMREALQIIKKHNDGSTNFGPSGSDKGVSSWVREIVFRELYRQTTVNKPHTGMNLPQNLKFEFVNWEDDEEGYQKWEDGTLGVPFV